MELRMNYCRHTNTIHIKDMEEKRESVCGVRFWNNTKLIEKEDEETMKKYVYTCSKCFKYNKFKEEQDG